MLKRWLGTVFVGFGAVLLCAALLLFLYNQREDKMAGEASDTAMSALHAAIENGNVPPMLDLVEDAEEATEPAEILFTEPTELTKVNIEGYDYVGYLSIPYYEIELPIIADWSEEKLHKAPCLQYGSPLTDDAVIAGHNYKSHFLVLHSIEPGEYLSFTDMNGYTIEYAVVEVKIISPTNVYDVINSEYDLQLYTCTTGGKDRVLVRCNRLDKIPSQVEQLAQEEDSER